MASIYRSAAVFASAAARSSASRSKPVLPRPFPTRRSTPLFSRPIGAAVGSIVSLMPLHSAIASTRMKSCIAVDSSCWSWLSQGFKEDF